VQHALVGEARTAGQRSAALEQDLRVVEDETERLYVLVRTMRALGEQLRERVGLPGPAIEPLPELPPRRSPAAPGVPMAAADTTITLASLPPDTGPWPVSLGPLAPLPSRSTGTVRVQQAGEAIARQWELWQQLSQAIDGALGQRARAARPVIRPAYGPITSGFGRRPGFYGVLAIHTGIDISLPMGTGVVTTANGTVTFAGVRSGFGNTVEVTHEGGLLTLYGHLLRPLVSPGQPVAQGQLIALSGNSGISTGPHLHYEVRLNGTPVDPVRYW
jgi:murein DD-endopeptidase MepM/ murein hydrolase activator NlpD